MINKSNTSYFIERNQNGILTFHETISKLEKIIEKYWLTNNNPYSGKSIQKQFSILEEELPMYGNNLFNILDSVGEKVIQHSLNIAHPKSIAHFHCNPSLASIAGEFIIGITNQSLDSWDESPSATMIELLVIQWFSKLIGWDDNSTGIFNSGGTMSNQMAIILSRNHIAEREFGINISEEGMACDSRLNKLRIIGSKENHFSIERGLANAGLGKNSMILIDTNKDFQIDIQKLEITLNDIVRKGEIPTLIIGNAGTTNHGVIDNLSELADIAHRHGAWFHVDAAYGGALLCSKNYRYLLKGIEKADSITIDPHKLFFQSVSCGIFMLKKSIHFDSIKLYSSYLNPIEDEEKGVPNLVVNSLQTSRRFDALKMYLTFRHMGVKGLGDCIDHTFKITKYFIKKIKNYTYFELPTIPQTNVILFRYFNNYDTNHTLNYFNKLIQEKAYFEGKVILSTTAINNKLYMKISLMNVHTKEKDIDEILEYMNNLIKLKSQSLPKNS